MRIVVLTPPLLSQKGDVLGSGIPFWPIEAAYVAAALRAGGHGVKVVDGFGEAPKRKWDYRGKYVVQGLKPGESAAKIPPETGMVVLSTGASASANSTSSYSLSLELVRLAKKSGRAKVVATGLLATNYFKDFLEAGADFVVLGEPEETVSLLASGKARPESLDGIAFRRAGRLVVKPKTRFIADLDSLPFPAFELFPLESYWGLGYAHGPVKGRYLPILASRGCPFCCAFCAVPASSQRKWRPRSAENVVDEMERGVKEFGVRDFHFEDYNPTFDKERVVSLCKEILRRKLKVAWKLAAGSKAEMLDAKMLWWMRRAGCDYISISPESGSPRVLKLMKKPFDYAHGLEVVRLMRSLGIVSQACFVLGFPGETDEDLAMTKDYVGKLARAGLDEIALFIMTPLPGSEAMREGRWDYREVEELTFSPKWRKDYGKLARARRDLYLHFFALKSMHHPGKMAKSALNVLRRRYDTKTEMTAYRAFAMLRPGLGR